MISLKMAFKRLLWFIGSAVVLAGFAFTGAEKNEKTIASRVRIEFGHTSGKSTIRTVSFHCSSNLSISLPQGDDLENDDMVSSTSVLHCGAGDIDALIIDAQWSKPSESLRKLPSRTSMWKYLLENGSPGQVERLLEDPWNKPDAPLLAIHLNEEGTLGFSVGLEQLLSHKAMWLPEHDVFITLADAPIEYNHHLASLIGQRTLDSIRNEPDASLEQYKALWSDFGNPLISDGSWEKWQSSWKGTKGHLIVTAAAHGSIYKFAIDRYGNVRPDFASPHQFALDFNWPGSQWKEQKIINGLPIISTTLERDGQKCELEQFAAPFGEIDAAIRGYIPSIMLTKAKISGDPGPFNFSISLSNERKYDSLQLKKSDGGWIISDNRTGEVLLMLETGKVKEETIGLEFIEDRQKILLNISGDLKRGRSLEFSIKLLSPPMPGSQATKLMKLDYLQAKAEVIAYWEKWIQMGAQFKVPGEEVNQLVRANIWHALVLPRHTIGVNNEPHMDIPYANTAYGQKNADWPINQSVYVDYMIYGLRGYEETAVEELLAMFHTQQQPDGRIGGFANWGVYSPGHLYAVAQNYLLSQNREQFERLLPYSMKLLDWCLLQVIKASLLMDKSGLILAPLNDLSNAERKWAFTQAYFYGGLERFGRALAVYGHPRASEVVEYAKKMKSNVEKAFACSTVKSPVVRLADGSWVNYVPSDAMASRRLMDEWYPTDVDTGPLHLCRLGALDATSWLSTAMLNDHEDNLFLKNLGAANEPVYIPQAAAYLMRDEPKAVIHSFYSMMACAFSHNQLTPLEHRWAHGQYYGPPSTDGAWFEVFRKMLLNEVGDDTLFIGQAVPRKWLMTGKTIEVKDAPTYFGPVSFTIEGENPDGELVAEVALSERNVPKTLFIRFRHPQSKSIRSATVNGKAWNDYNIEKEHIIIQNPVERRYVVIAKY